MRAWRTAAVGAAVLLAPVPAAAQLAPGDVLVTSIVTDLVYRLDPDAPVPLAPIPVPTGGSFSSPIGLAVDRNGLLLVVDNGPRSVLRVDPSTPPGIGSRALVAQFSQASASLRGVVALDDGRFFVADPGTVPLEVPPLIPLRGVTFFPRLSEVAVVGGLPSVEDAAGCLFPFDPLLGANCGNFHFPSGVALARCEPPNVVVLVADAGESVPFGQGRQNQAVLLVRPDEPFVPGTNDTVFSGSDLFAAPLGVAIAGDGSVLVTDIGTVTPPVPPRVLRIAGSPCGPLRARVDRRRHRDRPVHVPPDPPVEILAEGAPLSRPIGIAVAADGRIFVADNLADTVFQIPDAIPGAPETPIPLSTPGSVDGAWDLQIYDARPGPFFVADAAVPALLAIDPAVPSRSTITPKDPFPNHLVEPAALEVLPMGAGLVVADPVARAVIETTLGGAQTLVSQGGRLAFPTSASREAGGTYLVTDLGDAGAVPPLPPAVIRVDPSQPPPDDQKVLSAGGDLVRPVSGAIDASGYLIVADAGAGTAEDPARILRITPDVDAGAAGQVVLHEGTASVPLLSPVALALDDGGGVILVADAGDATNPPAIRRLIRSSIPPGAVALPLTLSSGGRLETPAGLAVDTDGSILVADGGDPSTADDGAVLRIDEISGLQSLVATDGTLEDPTGIGVTAPAPGAFVDSDGDGIADGEDNCLGVSNLDQRDSNGDGFGNACDFDYDDDGAVSTTDYVALLAAFGSNSGDPPPSRYDPDLDFDGDGAVAALDYVFFLGCYGSLPGESGRVPPRDPPGPLTPCFPAP